MIQPELKLLLDGQINWVGVNQYLVAIDHSCERVRGVGG